MAKQVFRQWDVSQGELFPPTFQELVPAGNLVHFVRRLVVETWSAIYVKCTETKGQPPYKEWLESARDRARHRPVHFPPSAAIGPVAPYPAVSSDLWSEPCS